MRAALLLPHAPAARVPCKLCREQVHAQRDGAASWGEFAARAERQGGARGTVADSGLLFVRPAAAAAHLSVASIPEVVTTTTRTFCLHSSAQLSPAAWAALGRAATPRQGVQCVRASLAVCAVAACLLRGWTNSTGGTVCRGCQGVRMGASGRQRGQISGLLISRSLTRARHAASAWRRLGPDPAALPHHFSFEARPAS